uniref:(northern house mosquito) hypothetical protein n=1 Tax=Culex pipiens TaxID=7175 RepID=A0A8D8D1M4_CULPI
MRNLHSQIKISGRPAPNQMSLASSMFGQRNSTQHNFPNRVRIDGVIFLARSSGFRERHGSTRQSGEPPLVGLIGEIIFTFQVMLQSIGFSQSRLGLEEAIGA